MTAIQAAVCIERGLKNVLSIISVRKIPMADGGEGTARVIVEATKGKMLYREVRGPRGKKRVRAAFGITGDGRTAVIEMAAASGLALLKPDQRNPMVTTTYGTGELIRCALDQGVRRVLVGIGGSATNDGGMGMARALGVRFLDEHGRQTPEGGIGLGCLHRIDMDGLDERLRGPHKVTVEVACDVSNPLVGPKGAAAVYGPNKGATPQMVKELDAGLRRLAELVQESLGKLIAEMPGAGAAGGLGGGLVAFLDGTLRPGVDVVIDAVELQRRIRGCDLVITGEGRLDEQTPFGKTPAGVARVSKEQGIPVIAICGSVGRYAHHVHAVGIDTYFSALKQPVAEKDLPRCGPGMLTECAEQVGRFLALQVPGTGDLRLRRKSRTAGA
jgi:glycerate kinase